MPMISLLSAFLTNKHLLLLQLFVYLIFDQNMIYCTLIVLGSQVVQFSATGFIFSKMYGAIRNLRIETICLTL